MLRSDTLSLASPRHLPDDPSLLTIRPSYRDPAPLTSARQCDPTPKAP
jgi:hypothetical protein